MALFLVLFSTCFLCLRAQPTPKKFIAQQHAWLADFFKELLLEEGAIYTLWGSKPLTIGDLYYYSPEEIQAWYENLSEEDKKTCMAVEPSHLEKHWEEWKKIQHLVPLKDFLLFKRPHAENPKLAHLYFVSIPKVTNILRTHYQTFYSMIGSDFNPSTIVYEIQDADSAFWQKALHHPVLLGILLGFGEENAWTFYSKYYALEEEFSKTIPLKKGEDKHYYSCSLENFPLPSFVVAYPDDLMVEKYKVEREEIQKIYGPHDFVTLTLEKLMSSQ